MTKTLRIKFGSVPTSEPKLIGLIGGGAHYGGSSCGGVATIFLDQTKIGSFDIYYRGDYALIEKSRKKVELLLKDGYKLDIDKKSVGTLSKKAREQISSLERDLLERIQPTTQ